MDLNGYSYQRRLPLFLYRPARLQMCWVGMYGTTGMREIDWLVGDAAVIPPAEERYYTRANRSRAGFLSGVLGVLSGAGRCAAALPGARHLTFGCFSSAYKLTGARRIAAYAAILRGAPASRLLLRNRTLDEASNRAVLLRPFRATMASRQSA